MHNDYEKIRLIIRYLEERTLTQPTLVEIADAIGLTSYNFQQLSLRWAGVSPKLFVSQLMRQRSIPRLAAPSSESEDATRVAWSGSSRLHDSFITLRPSTASNYCNKHVHLQIDYGFHQTHFGRCLAATTEGRLCWLSFTDTKDETTLEQLRKKWPKATFRSNPVGIKSIIGSIIPLPERFPTPQLPLYVHGTTFQIRVWEALLQIPEGITVTYGKIAEKIGNPRAARAVGTAIGANPVAYLIPCHRVIRNSGAIGNYRWSRERKHLLLAWEKVRQNPNVSSKTGEDNQSTRYN